MATPSTLGFSPGPNIVHVKAVDSTPTKPPDRLGSCLFENFLSTCLNKILQNGLENTKLPPGLEDWLAIKLFKILPDTFIKILLQHLLSSIENEEISDEANFSNRPNGEVEFINLILANADKIISPSYTKTKPFQINLENANINTNLNYSNKPQHKISSLEEGPSQPSSNKKRSRSKSSASSKPSKSPSCENGRNSVSRAISPTKPNICKKQKTLPSPVNQSDGLKISSSDDEASPNDKIKPGKHRPDKLQNPTYQTHEPDADESLNYDESEFWKNLTNNIETIVGLQSSSKSAVTKNINLNLNNLCQANKGLESLSKKPESETTNEPRSEQPIEESEDPLLSALSQNVAKEEMDLDTDGSPTNPLLASLLPLASSIHNGTHNATTSATTNTDLNLDIFPSFSNFSAVGSFTHLNNNKSSDQNINASIQNEPGNSSSATSKVLNNKSTIAPTSDHVIVNHNDMGESSHGKHRCYECNLDFTVKREYAKHMNKVHDEKIYQCPICPKKMSWQEGVVRHLRTVHKHELYAQGGLTQCSLCDKYFRDNNRLIQHAEQFHKYNYAECMKNQKIITSTPGPSGQSVVDQGAVQNGGPGLIVPAGGGKAGAPVLGATSLGGSVSQQSLGNNSGTGDDPGPVSLALPSLEEMGLLDFF